MKRYNVEIMLNEMKELNMNKKQFAEYCGVSVYNINQIIKQRNMNGFKCFYIVQKLDCRLDDFLVKEYINSTNIKTH